MGFIYKVTNKNNGKIYVGQTNFSVEKRWKQHCNDCKNESTLFHSILYEEGKDNFLVEILEDIQNSSLNDREKYWIQFYNSNSENGYNMTKGGDGRPLQNYSKVVEIYQQTKSISQTCNILQCCRETVHRARLEYNLPVYNNNVGRKIIRIDENGNQVIYDSIRQAAIELDSENFQTKRKRITFVINHRPDQKAYGFYWKELCLE